MISLFWTVQELAYVKKVLSFFFVFAFCTLIFSTVVFAQEAVNLPAISINLGEADNPSQVATSLQVLFYLTIITLAPSILIMLTSFTRIIISFHFLRSAMATQQMPPNQVLVGLALILTFFLMGPTINEINENALKPYSNGIISQEEALETGMAPLRKFMFNQVEKKDLALFISLSGETYETDDIPSSRVLIPAFILGEMTKGFRFGFFVYLPFLVIDMVVASTLMAMGMMMLPPAMISLPFKLLLFVLVDGWSLAIDSILKGFVFK